MSQGDLSDIFGWLKKPELFAPSTASLWDDEHISKGMLAAHLHPDWDAASRNHQFIGESVDWIIKYSHLSAGQRLLDLGCGPGLYTQQFASQGLNVTGIDLSRRSVSYARKQATQAGLDITYICGDYLEHSFDEQFDLITMIYCDFGVLADDSRDRLLSKVWDLLLPGGLFIFDVWTPRRFDDQLERTWWEQHSSGYWRPHPYLGLMAHYKYPEDHTELDQYVIIDENRNVEVYRCWDRYYTPKSIEQVMLPRGFGNLEFYGDVRGKHYDDRCDTLCLAARKP